MLSSSVIRSSLGSLPHIHLVVIALSGLPVFYAFYKISSRYLERRAFTNETAMDELSVLGKPHNGKKMRGRAVIVGGRYAPLLVCGQINSYIHSVSGMMTALACSNHFDDVSQQAFGILSILS
jgi:hypothetical protein